MAFKLAKRSKKEKKAKDASPKNKVQKVSKKQSNKKTSQADDVLAFLEKQKKDAKIKEEAGECMFC